MDDLLEELEEPERPRGRRRRGRTAGLIACAAVLGVVAGTCTGYVIQAGRAPDPLPPLSQPVMAQSKGKAPQPLSAERDRQVKMDGDLRKLLVPKPRGAKSLSGRNQPSDGWVSILEASEGYLRPDGAFTGMVNSAFRRAVSVTWREGRTGVQVRLTQYRDEEAVASADKVADIQTWAESDPDHPSTLGEPIPGSGTGMVYVNAEPDREPGYVPLYAAQASAARGDVLMEIWFTSPDPISKKRAMQVARDQWERLK